MRRLVLAVVFPTAMIGFLASPSWGASVNRKTGITTASIISDVASRDNSTAAIDASAAGASPMAAEASMAAVLLSRDAGASMAAAGSMLGGEVSM